jgi:hypothetical protein
MEAITKCPNCQGTLQYIPPSSRANIGAWVLLIVGLFCVWFVVGIVLIIIAFSMGFTVHEGDKFVCPSCGSSFARSELQGLKERKSENPDVEKALKDLRESPIRIPRKRENEPGGESKV